jgi:Family of unknown function (DUF6152)
MARFLESAGGGAMRHNSRNLILAVGCAALSTVATATAHHSFEAEFDSKKPVTLTGTITKVEWMNPHTYFYIDAEDETGKVANWAVEGGAPNVLYRQGWKPTSLKVGDRVTVHGSRAKNGSNLANAIAFVLPDGRCVFAGTSGPAGTGTSNCPQTSR